jgi:hypothetical protein
MGEPQRGAGRVTWKSVPASVLLATRCGSQTRAPVESGDVPGAMSGCGWDEKTRKNTNQNHFREAPQVVHPHLSPCHPPPTTATIFRVIMKLSYLPLFAALGVAFVTSAADVDPLESGFLNPPNSAKPHTWWHWMNGNITKAGITADLEAMKSAGEGGATIVNVDCGIPRGAVPFMSSEWREMFKFAVQEANRLDFQLCVENCAGWSSSGGPWNTPEHAMQRVTTSEIHVAGPTNFNGALPQPATTLNFYRDIAVLAFPASADEGVNMRDFAPVASASGGESPGDKLTDGDPETFINLPVPHPGKPQYAQLAFAKPFSARTVKLVGGRGMPVCSGIIEVSDDGRTFHLVRPFAFTGKKAMGCQVSLGDQPVAARFWRVQFTALGPKVKATVTKIPLAEIDLAPRLSIDNVDAKDGLNGNFVLSSPAADEAVPGAIPRDNIVDLTDKLTADGHLNWSVPAGDWVILRLGHTPTGVNNHPAPKEGEGLECDKFSKAALDAHWAGFMQKVLDDLGPLAGPTLDSTLIDSYEVGGQNWTEQFRQEFQKRRGYDLLPYLPAFTGRVVDNPQVSERFLWDVRRTIADLFAENYYGHFTELCHQHGLQSAVEPYTGPFESLQAGAPADIVMGEFWTGSHGNESIKLASSVAHIYGKTIVGAESFTASPEAGRWQNDPWSEKTLGDLMYCQGLNRYFFHRYAMQPWTNHWPGMTMGQWGFHFERTVTWWDQGKAWLSYISHCQFLLQQGHAVADAAYFTGESAPVETRALDPSLPKGYDYDDINADVLRHGATVKDGRINLPGGASYAVLVLPPTDADLTPATLQRIADLVKAGATVVGPRPQHSPSLADYPNCDAQVKQIADGLWDKCDGDSVRETTCGQGHVYWGKPLADVFAAQPLPPDFAYQGATASTHLEYAHRVAGATDIYFVSNQRRQFDSVAATFRVDGKIPELWHPDTGVIETAPVWSAREGRTTVRLDLDPAGSVFVLFRRAANNADHLVAMNSRATKSAARDARLTVKHAVYAATDGAPGSADVTKKLTDIVDDGQLQIAASNDLLDGDPSPNHVKELRVDYVFAGKSAHATVREGETLTFPGVASVGLPPPWEASLAADGSPLVQAWANGRVELRTAAGKELHAKVSRLPQPLPITGPWNLTFPPNWGAPPAVTLDNLISWTDHPDAGVRYFSGTATYDKTIEIHSDRLRAGRELWLDLGAVKNFAEVELNGQNLGILWKPPFRVNLTPVAKTGANHLVVKVTNLWPNRLIGDEQLPPDVEWDGKQLKEWPQWFLDGKPSPTGRLTFTTWHHWTKDSPLLQSGLLGPVTLRTAENVTVK